MSDKCVWYEFEAYGTRYCQAYDHAVAHCEFDKRPTTCPYCGREIEVEGEDE